MNPKEMRSEIKGRFYSYYYYFRRGNIFIFYAIIQVFASSCTHFVSSPEGTTTELVQKSGVLVYAPRTARAQKVVFDTPDKQLIHEPDTPFRKFFNSHSDDFAYHKVDYAKTTILNDIVSMVQWFKTMNLSV